MPVQRARSRGPGGFSERSGRAHSPSQDNKWGHPDGFPLEQVKVGNVYDGYVTNARKRVGIFVHFGAVKDGLLRVPQRLRDCYFPGMEVHGMDVVHIDMENSRVVLQPDPSTLPARYEHRRSPSRGASRGRRNRNPSSSERQPRSQSRPSRKNYDHPDGIPLDEIQEGSQWEDKAVTQAGSFGVFVDFGAVRDGRLQLPRGLAYHFKAGDRIPVCRVEAVDLDANRVMLSTPDPEGLAESIEKSRLPLDTLQLYDYANGCINAANKYGVFVNIGAKKDAKMDIPRREASQYLAGQQVQVQIVSIDLDRGWVAVVPAEEAESEAGESDSEEALDLQEPVPPGPPSGPPPRQPRNSVTTGRPQRVWPGQTPAQQEPPGRQDPPARHEPGLRPPPDAEVRSGLGQGLRPQANAGRAAPGPRSAPWPKAGAAERHQQPPVEVEQEEDDSSYAPQGMGEAPLETLRVGECVDGTVKGVIGDGRSIEVKMHGVSGIGLLSVDKQCDFLAGDEVQGMVVKHVDVHRQQVRLYMDDPELSQEGVVSEDDDRSYTSPPMQERPQQLLPKHKPLSRPKPAEVGLAARHTGPPGQMRSRGKGAPQLRQG